MPRCRYIDSGVSSLRDIDACTDDSSDDEEAVTSAPQSRFSKMTAGLCEVLEDIGLISFLPLNIEDKDVRAHDSLFCDFTYLTDGFSSSNCRGQRKRISVSSTTLSSLTY